VSDNDSVIFYILIISQFVYYCIFERFLLANKFKYYVNKFACINAQTLMFHYKQMYRVINCGNPVFFDRFDMYLTS